MAQRGKGINGWRNYRPRSRVNDWRGHQSTYSVCSKCGHWEWDWRGHAWCSVCKSAYKGYEQPHGLPGGLSEHAGGGQGAVPSALADQARAAL
eukprot:2240648-Pyramimonas_sp.AAC.1